MQERRCIYVRRISYFRRRYARIPYTRLKFGRIRRPRALPYNVSPMYDTVDFSASFNYSIKNYKKINVNFYIHDKAFGRIWNNADRYIEHLKCFHSVIAPDFSICTGRTGMPFVMNLWNKYRNHALAWYMTVQGIKVIPSVSILDKDNWDWGFSALPKRSVLSC